MGGGGAADEPTQLQVQLERLRQQLAEEQLLRRQAEEAVEVVAADRSRLQKARDELATALLACERRAAEAEEEQLRAEAQAAALEAALREQQQAAEASAAAAAAAGPLSPATAERLGSSAGVAAAASRSLRHTQSSKSDSGLAADLDILLAELDQERQRSEELVRTLEAAEREAVSATEKLLKAQQRIKQLGSGGKGRGLFGGMKKSASSASLPPGGAGGAAGAAAGGEAEAEETAAVLQQRIVALKASRDKLIGAFDAQAAEIERLSGDNAALAEVGCAAGMTWVPTSLLRACAGAGPALLPRARQGGAPHPGWRCCVPAVGGAAAGCGGQVGGAGAGQPVAERAAQGLAGRKRDVEPGAGRPLRHRLRGRRRRQRPSSRRGRERGRSRQRRCGQGRGCPGSGRCGRARRPGPPGCAVPAVSGGAAAGEGQECSAGHASQVGPLGWPL